MGHVARAVLTADGANRSSSGCSDGCPESSSTGLLQCAAAPPQLQQQRQHQQGKERMAWWPRRMMTRAAGPVPALVVVVRVRALRYRRRRTTRATAPNLMCRDCGCGSGLAAPGTRAMHETLANVFVHGAGVRAPHTPALGTRAPWVGATCQACSLRTRCRMKDMKSSYRMRSTSARGEGGHRIRRAQRAPPARGAHQQGRTASPACSHQQLSG